MSDGDGEAETPLGVGAGVGVSEGLAELSAGDGEGLRLVESGSEGLAEVEASGETLGWIAANAAYPTNRAITINTSVIGSHRPLRLRLEGGGVMVVLTTSLPSFFVPDSISNPCHQHHDGDVCAWKEVGLSGDAGCEHDDRPVQDDRHNDPAKQSDEASEQRLP